MHIIEIGNYGGFEYGVRQDTAELYRRHTDACCRLVHTNGSTEWHESKYVPAALRKSFAGLRRYIESHDYAK